MTTTTQQTTQHEVQELLDRLEFHRREAEKLADSPMAGDGGNYFLGKESGLRAAIGLVKRLDYDLKATNH